MLNSEQIKKLIKEKNLIADYIDLETQLNANGFDLTVSEISGFNGAGSLDFSNSERIIPETKEMELKNKKAGDEYGWWFLSKGSYKVKTNEIISLPGSLAGFAFSRSSLLRMGAYCQNGFWDAGFSGKSEFLLMVDNPNGINVKQNARLIQIAFMSISETKNLYNGIYKNLE